MPITEPQNQFELLIRARYPLIVLDTVEAGKAENIVRTAASNLSLHCYEWTRSRGITRGMSRDDPRIDNTAEPAQALTFVEREGTGLFLFRDLAAYLEEPLIVAHLLDVAAAMTRRRGALVMVGTGIVLPDVLRPHATRMRIPPPGLTDYRQMVERVTRDFAARMPVKVELSQQDRARLINNLMGLPLVEAEKIVARLILHDGALRAPDVEHAAKAKRDAVRQDGLLEYYTPESGLDEVAGLAGLKRWLSRRRSVVMDPERARAFGLRFPKGVLLLGMPGCGKSLCAKAVAREWGLPLLKLDPANLYDKFIGNSEKNFKRALETAERMAPVVLWIDELEKAFADGGSEGDGGVSRRIFGSFLSWLHERRGDAFVVATANDVSKLPPEFIRKGRFDEVFFVDLPTPDARRDVFSIHLSRRRHSPEHFDLQRLSAATDGFSGAEIEESVVSALYAAFAGETKLTTDLLIEEIAATRPLSQTMPERLTTLRAWARDRTVMAD